MPPSERTKKIIWSKGGGTCAICREILLIEFESLADTHLLGEVAHIVSEQLDGPRGVSPLNIDERNSEKHLVLLCLKHHKTIDDDPGGFTVERLHQIKNEHQAWVAARLTLEQVWKTRLHNFYYINVPRLNLLAASAGLSLDLSRYGEIVALHELGWELNGLLLGFEDLLSRFELKAIDIDLAVERIDQARGMIVSFNREFRTKNIRMPRSPSGYRVAFLGNLKKDPHIYADILGKRLIARVDPRWVTTTTAFCEFRPSSGKNKFAGIGIINSVDTAAKTVSLTPYLIGLPSNPFIEAFYDSVL